MKILLFGEFSGVHNNLKKELIQQGYSVTIFADGDSFKSLNYDIRSKIVPHNKWYKIVNCFYLFTLLPRLTRFDVVQFINSSVFPPYYYLFGIPQIILLLNRKKILYACGTDPNYIKAGKELEYFPLINTEFPWYRKKLHSYFIEKMDKIVPSAYSYYLGYKFYDNIAEPIPLPGSLTKKRKIKITDTQIKILFGVTREDFKGASYIYEALQNISEKYENRVQVQIVKRMPFKEYIELLKDTDILIDQCLSYSYGMNAIFSMQYGVIVLSGSEEVAMDYLQTTNCPVINIIPDAQQIADKLSELIELSEDELDDKKRKSQNYVYKYHNVEAITKKFLEVYKSEQENKNSIY